MQIPRVTDIKTHWLEQLQRFWHIVFPAQCMLCRAPGIDGLALCQGCLSDLLEPGNSCRICALPLDGVTSTGLCGRCSYREPEFETVFVPFVYHYPLAYLLKRFKFNGDLAAGRLLAQLMLLHRGRLPDCDLMVPVPMHRSRLRRRGFNQAAELAGYLSGKTGIRLSHVLSRSRSTEPQVGLSAAARRRNLRNAFAVTQPLSGQSVVLVDDVMTTGTTAQACASALKREGAGQVYVWVCARA